MHISPTWTKATHTITQTISWKHLKHVVYHLWLYRENENKINKINHYKHQIFAVTQMERRRRHLQGPDLLNLLLSPSNSTLSFLRHHGLPKDNEGFGRESVHHFFIQHMALFMVMRRSMFGTTNKMVSDESARAERVIWSIRSWKEAALGHFQTSTVESASHVLKFILQIRACELGRTSWAKNCSRCLLITLWFVIASS